MTQTPQPARPSRRFRIALILSLVLNFLFVGTLVGLVLVGADRRSDDGARGLRAVGLGPVLAVLSSEDRAELGQRLRDNRGELAQESRTLGRSVRAFANVLRAETFDRAAAEAALGAQRDHGAALQAHGHSLLLDQIETMTPDERAALAERIEEALERARDRRFGAGNGGPRGGGGGEARD